MYCNNCGTENPNGSRFCCGCGVSLESQGQEQNVSAGGYRNRNAGYNPSYSQPNYAPKPNGYSNVLPVVALIISIFTGNLIALVVAAFALSKYNNYERAFVAGDAVSAEAFGKSSKTLSIVSVVLSAAFVVFAVVAAVASFVIFGINMGSAAFGYGCGW